MTPRGIANQNPGNIRKGAAVWKGQAAIQSDPSFVQFVSPEYGIRAIAKIMKTYKAHGIHTIEQVISRWAPASENNTPAYIAAVCAECSVHENDDVDLDEIMPLLVKAIIWHENGCCPYTDKTIIDGIDLA